ncbi:MAG: MBOAT family O-acyltransferase [Oscillospiraceae bacterium]|nr:MBOAT family O-acyltransferase [Oscillospiraceae bacterium]
MTYTAYSYLFLYLPLTFLLYTVFPKRLKWTVLLLASYFLFYQISGLRSVCLFGTTLTVYGGALWLSRLQQNWELLRKTLSKEKKAREKCRVARQKRAILALVLLMNFGILALCKYSGFFGSLFKAVLPESLGTTLANKLLMPLGISFYTLQAAGYLLDVYRGKYAADRNLGRVALFLCFFPQITEGPIGRYDLLARPLYEGHSFNYQQFTFGLQRIVWGAFKKIVIADRANALVGTVFGDPGSYVGLTVLLASVLYTVQIYMEFSGAMDIVTGSASLFGVPLSENFERPFFSRTVNEFWRRWHITLGAWLRDYVFYSISLSKPLQHLGHAVRKHCSPFFAKFIPTAVALFFVWLGMGIWHGVGWKYVLYGMYYYVLMLLGMLAEPQAEMLCGKLRVSRQSKGYHVFQILRTCLLVNFGMLLFRADSTASAFQMFASIFRGFSLQTLADGSLLTLGCDGKDLLLILLGTLIVFGADLLRERGHALRTELAARPLAVRWTVYLAGILAVIVLGAYGSGYDVVDLIYAQF